MVKLWIFLDFRVKKKSELDELYFWITPIAFVGNARETSSQNRSTAETDFMWVLGTVETNCLSNNTQNKLLVSQQVDF